MTTNLLPYRSPLIFNDDTDDDYKQESELKMTDLLPDRSSLVVNDNEAEDDCYSVWNRKDNKTKEQKQTLKKLSESECNNPPSLETSFSSLSSQGKKKKTQSEYNPSLEASLTSLSLDDIVDPDTESTKKQKRSGRNDSNSSFDISLSSLSSQNASFSASMKDNQRKSNSKQKVKFTEYNPALEESMSSLSSQNNSRRSRVKKLTKNGPRLEESISSLNTTNTTTSSTKRKSKPKQKVKTSEYNPAFEQSLSSVSSQNNSKQFKPKKPIKYNPIFEDSLSSFSTTITTSTTGTGSSMESNNRNALLLKQQKRQALRKQMNDKPRRQVPQQTKLVATTKSQQRPQQAPTKQIKRNMKPIQVSSTSSCNDRPKAVRPTKSKSLPQMARRPQQQQQQHQQDKPRLQKSPSSKAIKMKPKIGQRSSTISKDEKERGVVGPASKQQQLKSSMKKASTKSKTQEDKKVKFDTVQIREYSRCLGDNPSTYPDGPSISLDWKYNVHEKIPVNKFELQRYRFRRSDEASLIVAGEDRYVIIKKHTACTDDEIEENIQQLEKELRRRQRSLWTKRFDRFQFVVEKCKRKFQ